MSSPVYYSPSKAYSGTKFQRIKHIISISRKINKTYMTLPVETGLTFATDFNLNQSRRFSYRIFKAFLCLIFSYTYKCI